jgi:plastocyanin
MKRLVIAALVIAVVAAAGLATRAGARAGVREITLVGRDMAFYVDGQSSPNPTIAVRPGERVRITLRNETPGIVHDLAIDALGIATSPLKAGDTDTLEFRAPDRSGRYDYHCRPHALMMRGVLDVTEER